MSDSGALRTLLGRRLAGRVRFDEPAARHTSLGVGGPIDALAFPESEAELIDLVRLLDREGIPSLPLGNGTNLLVTDAGFRGVLISLKGLQGLVQREAAGATLLEVQAGLPLTELVQRSRAAALTGLEFCAGIPGSVGGAVWMNAGAFGGEIKDPLVSVRLLDPTGAPRTEPAEMLRFAYRSLDLPAKTIIIGAAFRLQRGDGAGIAARVEEILAARRERHPLNYRSAGSAFKNPRDIPAGRLIEAAGLKGFRIGDAQVSEKHANFIVNRAEATATQVLELIALVQRRVLETTGRRLEPEVKIIGA